MNQSEERRRIALVTGGSRGIGRAVAQRLAETGVQTIFINYLQNETEAGKTKGLVEQYNCRCFLARANLFYEEEIDKLFQTVKAEVDRLDIFVHCAALGAFKPLKEIKSNQWDLSMSINARAFLLCVQKCLPFMKEGKIVALSSLGSTRFVPNYGAMGPTKAALESVIKYLAVELAPMGIQVNGVSGGLIQTDSIIKFPEAASFLQEVSARTPARRLGKPEDIADVVMFLLSPAARWIYGEIIVVDGGLSLL